jgi:3-(3-hydroxy-phenyl)propionate hydroxylase
MLSTFSYPRFAYRKPPELGGCELTRHPVVVVGAGPVGLSAAIDLAQRGVPVLLLDDDDTVSVGSRGVCYAKRTLEIFDRLGIGQAVVDKGVTWNVGRTFFGDEEVFSFNLLPDAGHHRPGMVNLQQYHLESLLVQRAMALPNLELRFLSQLVGIEPQDDHVRLRVGTQDGEYALQAQWLIAADGARSPIRRALGLDVQGQVFHDRFLIADVVIEDANYPSERRFWFDPPWHRGQSALMHRQADGVWRIDFQLGWEADPEAEKQPERVTARIKAALGEQVQFELEWVSVYTFQCRRMASFRHGRVLFAGDSAHQVSPFGARGANSGVQDADNLAWKLALVLGGRAPPALLDSYCAERGAAADENIANSTRSTDFMTPKSVAAQDFRDAALALARTHAFARTLVNSGRLSVPSFLVDSPLNTPDDAPFGGKLVPGAPMDDAPVRVAGVDAWLLPQLGDGFCVLLFADEDLQAAHAALAQLSDVPLPLRKVVVLPLSVRPGLSKPGPAHVAGPSIPQGERWGVTPTAAAPITWLEDPQGLLHQRCDARAGTVYLLRPDQHIAARWRRFEVMDIRAAIARATCNA